MAIEKDVLLELYREIKDGLSTSSISGELYSKGVITHVQKKYIKSELIEPDKTTYLLDEVLIPHLESNTDNFYKFLDVLENTDSASSALYIANLLRGSIAKKQKKQSTQAGQPIAGQPIDTTLSSASNQELDAVDVSKLWSARYLEDVLYEKKAKSEALPAAIKDEVLKQVVALLVTVNNNEYYAVYKYLEPLAGHSNIYKYQERIDLGSQQTEIAIYSIGQYGACVVAVRKISPGSTLRGGAITVPALAYNCFGNLGAIIGVGVAAGAGKANMCDVLVSSKVANYTKGRAEKGHFINRGEILPASAYLNELFTTPAMWPPKDIYDTLTASKLAKPHIRSGLILSGPYLVDDPTFKQRLLADFGQEAIGIEMEAAYLFAATQQTTTNTIIVKAVCDFGDGNKHKKFQPTAALLAANCVKHFFDDPQVPEMLAHRKVSVAREQ